MQTHLLRIQHMHTHVVKLLLLLILVLYKGKHLRTIFKVLLRFVFESNCTVFLCLKLFHFGFILAKGKSGKIWKKWTKLKNPRKMALQHTEMQKMSEENHIRSEVTMKSEREREYKNLVRQDIHSTF